MDCSDRIPTLNAIHHATPFFPDSFDREIPPLMQNEQLLVNGQRYRTQDPVDSLA